MSLFRRNYNSPERLSERIGNMEDRLDKIESQLQSLSELLNVAYRGGSYCSEAFYVVQKEKKGAV